MKMIVLIVALAAVTHADQYTDLQQQNYNHDALQQMQQANEISQRALDVQTAAARRADDERQLSDAASIASLPSPSNCYFNTVQKVEDGPLMTVTTPQGEHALLYVKICNGKMVTEESH